MTSARPGPTSAMSAPKKTKAAAVQKTPSTTSATSASAEGTAVGGSTAASGARATAAMTRLAPMAAPGDVDAHQGHDPGQAHEQPDEPRPGRALGVVEAQCQQRDEERHRGDDDRRQRRGDVALARRDEREGDDDLEQRVEREPASA